MRGRCGNAEPSNPSKSTRESYQRMGYIWIKGAEESHEFNLKIRKSVQSLPKRNIERQDSSHLLSRVLLEMQQ